MSSGTNDFDIASYSINDTLSLALSGYLTDLHDTQLCLDESWWDQNLAKELSLDGHLYFQTGDITMVDEMKTCCLCFSKKQVIEAGYTENLYEVVKSGSWTFDLLKSIIKDSVRDLDGNTIINENDFHGLLMGKGEGYCFNTGFGNRICRIDSDGVLKLKIDETRSIDILEEILNFAKDTTCVSIIDNIEGTYTTANEIFKAERALFRATTFEPIPLRLRDMETDFGIVPYPKYDESQERYYSIAGERLHVVSIPLNAVDLVRTAVITDALSCKSQDTIIPAFYERSIKGKVLRDDESADMLDIIFGTKTYDFGIYYNIGNYKNTLTNMFQTGKTGIASIIDTQKNAALNEIEIINQQSSLN